MSFKILIPHSDDEGLFATYICLRLKPQILVVYDSTTHEERFGKARGVLARRKESIEAAKILGCPIEFWGIPDTGLGEQELLNIHKPSRKYVIAPALQGGNHQHDLLSQFGDIYYATYSSTNLTPYLAGGVEIRPTKEEIVIKNKVLDCYKSQHGINKPHFDAVRGQPEYIQGILTASIRRALRLD